jgi:hypothetical protein
MGINRDRVRILDKRAMIEITVFHDRLKRIGVDIEMIGNFPWIYLHKVNGRTVTELYLADHGFTIAFTPIRKDQQLKFTNIGLIFEIIRKYK